MTTTEIVMVRHGETEWNRAGRIQGHSDSALTDVGVAQAGAAARRIAGEHFDHIFSSDLGRALHTARIVAGSRAHMIAPEPRLRERSFGAGEGLTYGEIEQHHPEMFSRIRATDPDFSIPGGESRRQLFERVKGALESLAQAHAGKRLLVVTHGGVLASTYRWLAEIPVSAPHPIEIPNAGYNLIVCDAGQWRIGVWGDVAHLDVETFEQA